MKAMNKLALVLFAGAVSLNVMADTPDSEADYQDYMALNGVQSAKSAVNNRVDYTNDTLTDGEQDYRDYMSLAAEAHNHMTARK